MSAEDLEKYETEMELQLYKEYRDVVGLFDPGIFRIGDTLSAEGGFAYASSACSPTSSRPTAAFISPIMLTCMSATRAARSTSR
jgi:hypothetical protein